MSWCGATASATATPRPSPSSASIAFLRSVALGLKPEIGQDRIMVARIESRALLGVVDDPVRPYLQSPLGVFHEDPIDTPRPAGGVRISVERSPERVERVRAFLVADGEVGVREARFGERLVGPVTWPAVEVSRNDGRRIYICAAGELHNPPHDELAAFPARQGTYVVEVRVQVEERQICAQHSEQRPGG